LLYAVYALCFAADNTLILSYDYILEERDGEQYHVTKNLNAVVETSKGQYHMSNLFNGNEVLGMIFCINT
jgi:hypothetical protein